jgi:hypothetical protein
MSITLDEVRAEALFAGDLQPSQHPPAELVRRSVAAVLRRYGSQWCAARMAQEFGDHPEAAAQRMTWALRVVRDCYGRAGVELARCRPVKARTRPDRAAAVAPVRCRYPTGRYRRRVQRGDRWC